MWKKWDESVRPDHIVAERSARSQTNIHENYKSVFAQYGNLSIQTKNEMTDQHNAWYLGTAFPYTLPSAVGGYDVPYKPRWRRPEDDDIPLPREHIGEWLVPVSRSARMDDNSDLIQHGFEGPACKVKLYDITRGLPQRIEGQFRRHCFYASILEPILS